MNIWELLGISPSLESKVIKQAYANKLRSYHPERNQEEFQNLREAYAQVLHKVNYYREEKQPFLANQTVKDCESELVTIKNATPIHESAFSYLSTEMGNLSIEAASNLFMKQMEALYNNPSNRINISMWKDLLNTKQDWQPSLKELLSGRVLTFLQDNYFLPQPVWVLFNEVFMWTEQEIQLYESYPENFIDHLLEKVTETWGLRYEFFPKDADMDSFIEYRDDAHVALMNNELDYAYKCLLAAQELYSDDPDLLRLLGTYFVRVGEKEQAIDAFNKLIDIYPADIDGFINRAKLTFDTGNMNQAFSDYQHILEQMPDHLQAMNGLARCYLSYNRLFEAKILFEITIEKHPHDLDSRIWLYKVNKLLLENTLNEVSCSPSNIELKLTLAQLYYDLELYKECCQTIREIQSLSTLHSDMFLLWGKALAKQGQLKECLKIFNKALDLAQGEGLNGFDILVEHGIAHLKLKNGKGAISKLSEALKIKPDDTRVLSLLSNAHQMIKDWAIGIYFADRAIEVNPLNWQPYVYRGICHYKVKNYREAIQDHTVMLEHEYQSEEAWYRKGMCHFHLEQYEEASECLSRALAWGHNKYTYYYLATAHYKNNDFESALEAIQKFKEHHPEDSDGYVIEGDIYRAMGDYNAAKEVYCKGSELFPDDYYPSQRALYVLLKEWNKSEFKRIDKLLVRLIKCEESDMQWVLLEGIRFLLNAKSWKNALILTEKYIKLYSKKGNFVPLVQFYSGVAYFHEGLYKESLNHLEQAYKSDHRNYINIYLSMAYYQTKNMEKALVYADQACLDDPEDKDYQLWYEQLQHHIIGKRVLWGLFKIKLKSVKIPENIYLEHQEVTEIEDFHYILANNNE